MPESYLTGIKSDIIQFDLDEVGALTEEHEVALAHLTEIVSDLRERIEALEAAQSKQSSRAGGRPATPVTATKEK